MTQSTNYGRRRPAILAIAQSYPLGDRQGADLRYLRVLEAMKSSADVSFYAYGPNSTTPPSIAQEEAASRETLRQLGISILEGPLPRALGTQRFDAAIVYYWGTAHWLIDDVRYHQPSVPILVDNGDIDFRRRESKAKLTGLAEDFVDAETTRRKEIACYRRADGVVTISSEDSHALVSAMPDVRTYAIPNIHDFPVAQGRRCNLADTLVFVGTFTHPPNVDAILYFTHDILPVIVARRPTVRLRIVGFNPPPQVLELASTGVEVLGHVPRTTPYLLDSDVSIAPIRYGAGVKGKVGEAMSHGLPVVTTSVGAEGFGFTAGDHALIADTPQQFAESVLRLLADEALYARVAQAGYEFVRKRYSQEALAATIEDFVQWTLALPAARMPRLHRMTRDARALFQRHIAWRLAHRNELAS